MSSAVNWWFELRRASLLLALALAIGWLAGAMLMCVALAALLLLGWWLYQLWRVADWMQHAGREPPEAGGLWGELFDSVYHLQRREREERDRLQTEVSYLRDSFAALQEAAVMIDPDGRIEWSNLAAQTLLGLQYPRDRDQVILNLLRIPDFNSYLLKGDFKESLLLESPVAADLWLSVDITPFGRGSRLMLARDITRMVRLEEMRRDFVANVSHELRTPLTVISGYLDTLVEHDIGGDARLRKPLLQMQEQAQRMEILLRDLLWLSQVESTDGQDETAVVDVAELLNDIKQQSEDAHPGRQIIIRLASERKLHGDYRQLYSAVSNLVQNALKYSAENVEVVWQEEAGHSCLSVTDHGPGIDTVHLPRLTERFYRVDKSRSLESGGTGLGLAIVKHVLARHHAHLEISSQLGVGSCFRCIFPL